MGQSLEDLTGADVSDANALQQEIVRSISQSVQEYAEQHPLPVIFKDKRAPKRWLGIEEKIISTALFFHCRASFEGRYRIAIEPHYDRVFGHGTIAAVKASGAPIKRLNNADLVIYRRSADHPFMVVEYKCGPKEIEKELDRIAFATRFSTECSARVWATAAGYCLSSDAEVFKRFLIERNVASAGPILGEIGSPQSNAFAYSISTCVSRDHAGTPTWLVATAPISFAGDSDLSD